MQYLESQKCNFLKHAKRPKEKPMPKAPKRREVEKRAFFFRLHFADTIYAALGWTILWLFKKYLSPVIEMCFAVKEIRGANMLIKSDGSSIH